MTESLGRLLSIRSMVYVAGKPIPFFWPMRSFIHHNPLHGLEHLPFDQALTRARHLFHARTCLSRSEYQRYLEQGVVCRETLFESADRLIREQDELPGINLGGWFQHLLTSPGQNAATCNLQAPVNAVQQVLQGDDVNVEINLNEGKLSQQLINTLQPFERPLYESIDLLYGSGIGAELDELVIKSCLEFFDEGQSVWGMPSREQGFFRAWREMNSRNKWLSRRARFIQRLTGPHKTSEAVIEAVMNHLQVPEDCWMNYFTVELSRLHGWVGFIRWRENARHYYWGTRYPADLVDYLAIRLTLSAALLAERLPVPAMTSAVGIKQAIEQKPCEFFLRHELYSGTVYPPMAQEVEQALSSGSASRIKILCRQYLTERAKYEAMQCANWLLATAGQMNEAQALQDLTSEGLQQLLTAIMRLERHEDQLWLLAMEHHAMQSLLQEMHFKPEEARDKRPFVQALFCIDTRSERIRRHLESVGDYQTYGIAGFFGVPFSFLELGKGSENHLCPILLTPKNLVLEIPRDEQNLDAAAISTLQKAMHELKESIFSPFVTVEAIGLLFGFDMVGKTLAPKIYNGWRSHLHQSKPVTYLLQDKMSREQADSIVRAVQRAVIENAVEHELGVAKERITDDVVRELRECAMQHQSDCPVINQQMDIDEQELERFIQRLRAIYRINPSEARLQLERLGRIGFSIEEQVGFVSQALRAIGLTKQFSRFVLLVGHGSSSENNPYESALDCGACGGNHGLINARVLAQMANKPQVRVRLREQGLQIEDDVCFIPALHNTTTDALKLYDLDLLPSSHLIYLDRLRNGLIAASRLCAQERLVTLQPESRTQSPSQALAEVQRNAMDWSQVRPEWGLSRNVYFVIGRRELTRDSNLQGRSFLHSYDYRADPRRRLLENILGGPLVVGQWINLEHYFSTVDNERFGSGSKVYHNVAGRFGVMTGNLSDLRTGLPAQTVLDRGTPYHEPMRLITLIEAPFEHAWTAIQSVASVRRLVRNHWIRLVIIDPETHQAHIYQDGQWAEQSLTQMESLTPLMEACA